jgi:ATP-dependent protease ClpP protease subunit
MEESHKIDKLVRYITDDPIYQIHSFNIDLKANHIYLVGNQEYIISVPEDCTDEPGVEYSMASGFIKNLNILMRKSGLPILIHMKTCGGHWVEGMAIYDAVKACPNRVTILNYTHARSMSSLIFQAADKRVMMPNSVFMFHEGTMEFSGTTKQFRTEYEEDKRARAIMLEIYIDSMKHSGSMSSKTRPQIRRWLIDQMDKKEEVYLDAKQAVEYGFADEVFGQDGHYDWKKLIED